MTPLLGTTKILPAAMKDIHIPVTECTLVTPPEPQRIVSSPTTYSRSATCYPSPYQLPGSDTVYYYWPYTGITYPTGSTATQSDSSRCSSPSAVAQREAFQHLPPDRINQGLPLSSCPPSGRVAAALPSMQYPVAAAMVSPYFCGAMPFDIPTPVPSEVLIPSAGGYYSASCNTVNAYGYAMMYGDFDERAQYYNHWTLDRPRRSSLGQHARPTKDYSKIESSSNLMASQRRPHERPSLKAQPFSQLGEHAARLSPSAVLPALPLNRDGGGDQVCGIASQSTLASLEPGGAGHPSGLDASGCADMGGIREGGLLSAQEFPGGI